MRAPAWFRLRRNPVADVPGVSVSFTVDVSPAMAAIQRLGAAMPGFGGSAVNALDVIQAGNLERWYVRGAMDPAYADPRDRDAMVRELVTGGGYQAHALAARFLAGWVEHHEPTDVCTCTMTNPKWWTTYGGATEPGSQWEWEPTCDVHGEDAPGHRMATYDTSRGRGYLLERRADAHPWAPWRWRQRFVLGVDQDPHEWPAFDYFGADL